MKGKRILVSLVFIAMSIMLVVANNQSEMIAKAKKVTVEANTLFNSGQKQDAIELLENFLVEFDKLSADEKQKFSYIGGWRNFYLAAYYSDL